ncbi:MAG: ATP:cob(I)alamin adenosyltransferase [Candidatus Blackburnbacteria bacterium RIFCSPHIGHO2_12_FULL_41_13b]|uniref:Corrinoid adenosyltransferase n=1 Tax=Candidatus Blackburnbacteria bacterium RIFCSPHIGHO2_12_FULL_41_13b TaxID=1797517 RepID=A0A1G1V7H6_9BACT|nr:MAG: ATP:cob(I)alamin adenosyltransferase [Candidatus Blackburnbacteria bacterium RIFCSPHIGHO2_12_FULL_41_13b]
MAVYTKKGDKGKTSLYGEPRFRSKSDQRVIALGSIDELNSHLGFVSGNLTPRLRSGQARFVRIREEITSIQRDLFEIASCLATPSGPDLIGAGNKPPFEIGLDRVRRLEKIIDELEGSLPALANFIFPGGSRVGSALHVARSVCRRAEREVVKLDQKEKIEPNILIYINRLSDALFMIAREVNRLEKKKEEIWKAK